MFLWCWQWLQYVLESLKVAYYFLSWKTAILTVVQIASVILQARVHNSVGERGCFCSTDGGLCTFSNPPSIYIWVGKQLFLQRFVYFKKPSKYQLLLAESRCFCSTDGGFCILRNPPLYKLLSQKAGASSVLNSISILSGRMQCDSRANYSDLYSRRTQFESRTGYRL
jgi:hypothetical protein